MTSPPSWSGEPAEPGGHVDLSAQLAFLPGLLRSLEPLIERLAPADQMRLYGRLDQVLAILAGGLHAGVLSLTAPPFIGLDRLAGQVRELTIEQALGSGMRPGPGLAAVLAGALRRQLSAGQPLRAYLEPGAGLPPTLDLPALASYVSAELPAAGGHPPVEMPPELYQPSVDGKLGGGEQALADAAAHANGALDSLSSVADLLSLAEALPDVEQLTGYVVDRFVMALEARNVPFAASALGILHAEAMLKAGDPALAELLERTIRSCGEPPVMRAYAAMLAETRVGSSEEKLAADLLEGLRENAVVSLVDLLAVEPLQSTRRKLLNVLATTARGHLVFASYLSHPQWYVVRNVVWVLGRLGAAALPALLKAGAHRDPRVRREVVRGLASAGGKDVVGELLAYLEDRDDAVLREACARLVTLRAPEAVAALETLLEAPSFAERELDTIVSVARALAALGGGPAAARLESAAEAKAGRGWLRSPEAKKVLRESADAIRSRLGGGRAPA